MHEGTQMQGSTLVTVAILLLVSTSNSPAADANENAAPVEEHAVVVEEVIVTANRRQESLQEVPMSITAFTEDFFKDSGTTSFESLEQYTPSLIIAPMTDSRSTSIRIRGIGQMGVNAGVDPSVGVFIDGVYQGRAGMSVGDLMDIARVEVLRGPQGTLYGKNTAAGAISIVSRKPDDNPEADIEFVKGNYDASEIRGMANLPFGNSGNAARFSFYNVERDGWHHNETLNQEVNNANKWGVKARAYFDFGDFGDLLVSYDHADDDTDCCSADVLSYDGDSKLQIPFSLLSNALDHDMPVADGYDGKHYTDVAFKNEITVEGFAVEWNHELANNDTITWLNAIRKYDAYSIFDGDFSDLSGVLSDTLTELEQVSSELRITSPSGDKIEYQGGLYYYYQEMLTIGRNSMLEAVQKTFAGGALVPEGGVFNTDDNLHETWSYAAFGQSTWIINDNFRLTGGLRWTKEKKARVGTQTTTLARPDIHEGTPEFFDAPPIMGPPISEDQERKKTNLSGTLRLRYFQTEDLMWYASVSRGFKSGGFNQLRTHADPNAVHEDGTRGSLDTEFDDEKSQNAEVGWKGSWMEKRLQVNGTVFYTNYDDFQALTIDGSAILVRNAGSLRSYGLEMDLIFALSYDLQMGMSLGYNKTEYTNFDEAACTVDVAVQRANEAGMPPYLLGCVEDLKGRELDNAPEWTVSTWFQYEKPWKNQTSKWFSRLEYNYTDEIFLEQDLDPYLKNDATHLVNLRFGVAEVDNKWEVTVWGRNLLDEDYLVAGFDIPTFSGYAGVQAPPATFGVSYRYRLD